MTHLVVFFDKKNDIKIKGLPSSKFCSQQQTMKENENV